MCLWDKLYPVKPLLCDGDLDIGSTVVSYRQSRSGCIHIKNDTRIATICPELFFVILQARIDQDHLDLAATRPDGTVNLPGVPVLAPSTFSRRPSPGYGDQTGVGKCHDPAPCPECCNPCRGPGLGKGIKAVEGEIIPASNLCQAITLIPSASHADKIGFGRERLEKRVEFFCIGCHLLEAVDCQDLRLFRPKETEKAEKRDLGLRDDFIVNDPAEGKRGAFCLGPDRSPDNIDTVDTHGNHPRTTERAS